jgi:hypothetical protein
MIGNTRNNRIGNLCRVRINRWINGVLVPEERFFRSKGQAADFATAILRDKNVTSVKVYDFNDKPFMTEYSDDVYEPSGRGNDFYA